MVAPQETAVTLVTELPPNSAENNGVSFSRLREEQFPPVETHTPEARWAHD